MVFSTCVYLEQETRINVAYRLLGMASNIPAQMRHWRNLISVYWNNTHRSHYLFSDYPKAYSEFSKSAPVTSSSCWLNNNHVKDTQGSRVIMLCVTAVHDFQGQSCQGHPRVQLGEGEMWIRSFISTVRLNVHINPSRKRNFFENALRTEGIRRLCVLVWTENISKAMIVNIIMRFPCQIFSQRQNWSKMTSDYCVSEFLRDSVDKP